jgi:hypothetical protein
MAVDHGQHHVDEGDILRRLVLVVVALNDIPKRIAARACQKALALSSVTRKVVADGRVTLSDIPTVPTNRVLQKTVRDAGVARTWGVLEPLI